jgi:hypothetical protein
MTGFMDIFGELGAMRFLMAFSFLAVITLTVWSASQLAKPGAEADPRLKAWVDGVLFWGGFAAIAGMLGSLMGIIVMFQRIEQAGQVMPTIVAGGAKVGLLSSSVGLMILGVAALAWFPMQLRWRFLQARNSA